MEKLGSLVGWPLSLFAYNAGGLPTLFRTLFFAALISNIMPARSLLRSHAGYFRAASRRAFSSFRDHRPRCGRTTMGWLGVVSTGEEEQPRDFGRTDARRDWQRKKVVGLVIGR